MSKAKYYFFAFFSDNDVPELVEGSNSESDDDEDDDYNYDEEFEDDDDCDPDDFFYTDEEKARYPFLMEKTVSQSLDGRDIL